MMASKNKGVNILLGLTWLTIGRQLLWARSLILKSHYRGIFFIWHHASLYTQFVSRDSRQHSDHHYSNLPWVGGWSLV